MFVEAYVVLVSMWVARSAYPALDRLMLKHMVEIISHKGIIVKPVSLKKGAVAPGRC